MGLTYMDVLEELAPLLSERRFDPRPLTAEDEALLERLARRVPVTIEEQAAARRPLD